MGFTGKQVIHPDQVPVVRQAFSPSPERIKWALGLIEAFHEHQKSGRVRLKQCHVLYNQFVMREILF